MQLRSITCKIKPILPLLFEGAIILCTLQNIVYMHSEIMHIDNPLYFYFYHPATLTAFFTDIMFVYFIPFFVPKQKIRIPLFALAYIISTGYIATNIGYSRYFDTYLPLNLYFEFNNLNGLSNNVLYAFRRSDVVVCASSVIALLALFAYYKKRNIAAISIKKLVVLPTILLLLDVWPAYLTFSAIEKEYCRQKEFFSEEKDHRNRLSFCTNMVLGPEIKGLQYGLFNNLFFYICHRFMFNKDQYDLTKYADLTSSINYNLEKSVERNNVIIILVESLSSFVIDRCYENGDEITPVLNKLVKEGAYYPHMKSQTQLGESSDGQFSYLTGLLPLLGTVTVNEISNDSIDALPNMLKGYYSQMVIPTSDWTWSQKEMCKKYGFNRLYSIADYEGGFDEWLDDKQLFEFAATLDNNLVGHQPFVSVILTSSMHSPYNRELYSEGNHTLPDSLSQELKNYINTTHYTDKHLGAYIESLKSKGVYDCSIIAIVADHKPNVMSLNMKNKEICAEIPLIILNSPVELTCDKAGHIDQICVFPTLLDLLGVDSEWRGVGKSLLMPDSIRLSERELYRSQLEQEISEAVIWSHYNN